MVLHQLIEDISTGTPTRVPTLWCNHRTSTSGMVLVQNALNLLRWVSGIVIHFQCFKREYMREAWKHENYYKFV